MKPHYRMFADFYGISRKLAKKYFKAHNQFITCKCHGCKIVRGEKVR